MEIGARPCGPSSFRLLASSTGADIRQASSKTLSVTQAPFTVDADIGLGARAAPWIRAYGADVVVRRGAVPAVLSNPAWRNVAFQYAEGQALITVPCGVRFLVEGGESIRWAVDEGRGATDVDVRTFLIGAAWPVLALQRGLLPLHASAVSRGRVVHGFLAGAGGGKSMTAAGLAARGWSFFADDVLLVAPAPPGQEVLCHSLGDLKLRRNLLALVDATALGPVRSLDSEVRAYAEPRRWSSGIGGRLATLHYMVYQGGREADLVETERLVGHRASNFVWRAVYNRPLAQEIVGQRRLHQLVGAASARVEMSVFRWNRSGSLDDVLDRLAQDLRDAEAAEAQ